MTNLGEFAIEHAPWLMLGALVLFVARLLANIQRSEKEERARLTGIAEDRVAGFLTPDGSLISEPTLFPNGDDSHGTLVVYEFQPSVQSATIRGRDRVLQSDLERIRVGTTVRVRFNPKLPALSRLDAREMQPYVAPNVPSAIPTPIAAMSTRLTWITLGFVVLGFTAALFPNRVFVPSLSTAIFSYVIAALCAAWISVVSRRVPARLPETPASRFITLWARPTLYVLVTMLFIPPFFGNFVPAAITSATGKDGELRLSLSGSEAVFRRSSTNRQLHLRCAKARFKGIPSNLVGEDALCADLGVLPAEGTVVKLTGQVSYLGILVTDASW